MSGGNPKMTPEGFWGKCDTSGGPEMCWPWLGHTSEAGYGQVGWNNRVVTAHRLAAFLAGLVPSPSQPDRRHRNWLRHRCDNNECCNPDHLYLEPRK